MKPYHIVQSPVPQPFPSSLPCNLQGEASTTIIMPTNDVINTESTAEITPIATSPTDPIDLEKKKKNRSSFGIFKAALYMLRAKPKDKEKKKSIAKQNSVKAPNNATWKKLVGSMRPLHMQEVTQSPPPSIAPESPPPAEQPWHPASPAASSSSSGGTMSKYASASSLRDLYNSSDDEDDYEEEDPDEVFDAICGDEMIDAKAEEFIAQFYRQIQLQNYHSNHRKN